MTDKLSQSVASVIPDLSIADLGASVRSLAQKIRDVHMATTLITNFGEFFTGELADPVANATSLLVEDGTILTKFLFYPLSIENKE